MHSPLFQTLEPRTLLANVNWDAGGGDNLWSNPLNWSTDTLPTSSDRVALDMPGQRTVIADVGPIRVNELLFDETLIINRGVTLSANSTLHLSDNADLRINGLLNWAAGEWDTDKYIRVNAGGRLNIGSSANPGAGGVVLRSNIDNNGILAWQGGVLSLSETGSITNNPGKRFDIASATEARPEGGASGTIANLGTIRRGGAANTVSTIDVNFLNAPDALVSVLRGTLYLGAVANPGQRSMTNSGRTFINLNATLELQNDFTHTNAPFLGQGSLTLWDGVHSFTGNTRFENNDARLQNASSLLIPDGESATFSGFLVSIRRPFQIDGTLNLENISAFIGGTTATPVEISGQGQIILDPQAILSLANVNLSVEITINENAQLSFVSDGTGNISYISVPITNLGQLNVSVGELLDQEGASIINSGVLMKTSSAQAALRLPIIQVNSPTTSPIIRVQGGTLTLETPSLENPASLTINNNATLNLELGDGTFTSTGNISMEEEAVLNITGNLNVAGSFSIRATALSHSTINITGQLTLAALLSATFLGDGFAANQTRTIFTFASRSGTFGTFSPSGLAAPLTASLIHNPATIRIRIL